MSRTFAIVCVVLLLAATVVAACAPSFGGPVEKTIYVGPYQVDCTGVALQKCLRVKEKPEQEWTLFYDSIQGFAYEEGFEYELRVTQEKVKNPPADASAFRWTLIDIVGKTRTLEGTTWVLSSYLDRQGQMVPVLPGSQVTARFQEGQVGGNASCNSYFGTYQVDGGKMTVQIGGSTTMYCAPEALMAQEQDYLAALGKAGFHLFTSDELRIAEPSGQTLLKYTVLQPKPLLGTNWQLSGYNNGKGGFVSVLAGSSITALFGEDGSLTGSAGCNSYTAQVTVDGSALSIGPVAATRMMCGEPQGIMEQETAYLAALATAASYRIQGDGLELLNAEGTTAVSFIASAGAAALNDEALKNMTYKSEWTQSGTAPLTDGEYREQAAPGSATETVITLTDWIAYGDLNGQPSAAVILVTDPGGSGTFYELAAVVEQDGQPVHVASALLGDRVQINALTIDNNQIFVDMVTQGPNDPMCCPTQQVVRSYALQGDQLVQTSAPAGEPEAGTAPALTGTVWKWEKFLESNDKVLVVNDPNRYTVEFLADGQLNIQADCNQVGGTYTVDGSQMTIGLGASTQMACPPDTLDSEYLRYLGDVVSFMFENGQLALALRYDTGIMMFTAGE